MELKSKKVEYYEVDYKDLDKFINHHFFGDRDEFKFVAEEEASNDSDHAYTVDGEDGRYDESEREKYGPGFMTSIYLNEACCRGLIPKGNYLVTVY